MCMCVHASVCVCVGACVRARACVRASVRVCMCVLACVDTVDLWTYVAPIDQEQWKHILRKNIIQLYKKLFFFFFK